jgi:restriction endonuclease S subunit
MKTNWQIKKLDEICDILIGGTPSRGVVDYWKEGTLPWVSIRDMSREGSVINNTNEKITEKGAKESNVKLIPKGSLLFSFKLSIGKLAVAGFDLYTNEAIAALVIKDKEQLDRNFLHYYISQMVFDDVTTAVKGSTLNKNKIKNLEIPLPPLEIQNEIVTKLDEKFAKLHEAKKLREEVLLDTEKILSQTLHEIFDEGRKNGWEEVKIIDTANISPAKSEIKDFSNDTAISFIPMSSVDEYSQAIKEQEERKLGEVRKGYTYFKKGDIILAKVTPCMENGKIAISDNLKNEVGFGSSEFHVIRADKKLLNPKYLYQILRQKDFREVAVTKMTGTSGLKRVPKEFIENYKIMLPSLEEQEEIVNKLDGLSEKIKTLRELQKSQLEDLKLLEKAYLKEAFNGELR